jgi:hypothetical protein
MLAAEDGLLTALQASGALAGVTVQLGDPGAAPPAEIVWIVEDASADWNPEVTMGQAGPTLDEVYELGVKVVVMQPGDDYKRLRDRAGALADAVCDVCRTSRTLGGAVDDSYPIRVERSTGAWDTGRGIEYLVTIRARGEVGP